MSQGSHNRNFVSPCSCTRRHALLSTFCALEAIVAPIGIPVLHDMTWSEPSGTASPPQQLPIDQVPFLECQKSPTPCRPYQQKLQHPRGLHAEHMDGPTAAQNQRNGFRSCTSTARKVRPYRVALRGGDHSPRAARGFRIPLPVVHSGGRHWDPQGSDTSRR
jgi:hypothetical protein